MEMLALRLAAILCIGAHVSCFSGHSRSLLRPKLVGSSLGFAAATQEASVVTKEVDTTKVGSELFQQLLEEICSSKEDETVLEKAFQFVQKHADHKATSERALGVASILAGMKLDVASVVAGLVQCSLSSNMPKEQLQQELEQMFGSEIVSLVQGVAEIDSTLSSSYHQQQYPKERETENYRKLILALAEDIRVVLIKLACQTQRVRMLSFSQDNNPQHKKRVAQETLDLYAPLAHRLGMYTLKIELEDQSLRYWKPKAFHQIKVMVSAREAQRQQYTDKVIRLLQAKLIEGGLTISQASVTGRAKSFYSIYQKMQQENKAFDDIQDLMAFRIIVDNDVSQCYTALGIVHANWKPVAGRFKDYIALSKPNGYQSLHTTVIGPENKRMEVQIRTHEMHRVAEGGIAAHWMYKNKSAKATGNEAERYKWLRQLVQWAQHQDSTNDRSVAAAREESDIFEKEVFVFSPGGQLFALTQGATVLDFAYRVHSQVGDHCMGAKVNGKMVPLKYTIENGDTVEILQSSNQTPKQEWLKIVKTAKAKGRIKSWLKKQEVGEESLELGREMLEKGLRKYEARNHVDGMSEYKKKLRHVLSVFKLNDEQQLLRALVYGQVSVANVLQEVFVAPPVGRPVQPQEGDELVVGTVHQETSTTSTTPDDLVVGGKRNILISFCRNCNALYGEDVQGVVTQGRGVKVHRMDCRYLLESDPARRVDAVWDEAAKSTRRSLVLEVLFEDSPVALAEMSKAISSANNVNIGGAILKTFSNGQGLARFELILCSIHDLKRVTVQLQQEPCVINVKRR